MRAAVALAICVLYFAGVLVGAPLFGPAMTPWFLAAWSTVFVWAYLTFARGRRATALSIVMTVTILVPILVLIALVWPLYRSPSAIITSLWSEFRERGPLGALELFVPLGAAAIFVFAFGRASFKVKRV